MKRILVTGGSGKLSRATIKDLVDHGYDVVSCDVTLSEQLSVPQMKVDFENLHATMEALAGMVGTTHERSTAWCTSLRCRCQGACPAVTSSASTR